ncbi:MAG: acetylornithine transaminase [Desulfobacteraceae bacterium]|nr:acetylornithine transaminase [Desulfobacteraceae bacterium]
MDTIEKTDTCIFNTYARIPTVFVKGEGSTLWDDKGNRYTDFLAGIAVASLGHCHPAVTKAIADQAATLVHVSNIFYTEPQAELARLLVEKSFADKVFFANSGAEANEAAIKLARRYFKEKGNPDRFKIITMTQSFHGRTMATLSATGQDKIKNGFSPLVEGFVHCPFNDLDALKSLTDDSVCAVMMECVQGEGGVVPVDPAYIKAVRQLCDEKGILLIFDEVQTGMGRCGTLFAHELFDVKPDIMTLAKALGNGLPIGAMLANEEAAKGFALGSHATTFGGTPLVTRAALCVLEIISQPDFLKEVREKGAYLKEKLTSLMANHPYIKAVRGEGLLVGMEIDGDAGEIVTQSMKKGFILNAIQGKVLRFAPPLVITREEIDSLVTALDGLLE